MDVRAATIIPGIATSAEHARALVALDGAAIVRGIASVDDAIAFGYRMLGDRAVRVRPQFEATKEASEREAAIVDTQPADERGRKRTREDYRLQQPAHNDGFSFGNFAPDHMFLHCARPCSVGGASFLVDAVRLVSLLAAGDADFASFVWDVPIDHSVPNFPQNQPAPIARMISGGRLQVRSHPNLAPLPGPDEQAHWPFVQTWLDAVAEAKATGPRFRADVGDLLCIDNYRMLHGRDGFVDDDRLMTSIWAWTADAVAIPDGPLDLVTPDLAALRAM